ncbi:T9SS type A sorting domain-containing protein [Marinoscillum furvescens]|uniref:Putative secreted protein (Por secretion system target) n=1 Tax=Marinoscillum furvescens DSM 4134 TaxID=1122208 RepID=A0A3D9L7E4_MARFU|nr:T9SS type A sorting domain-containing protein [Marinoscillum furvescens]REE02235.1 putative secreted protein (Por secretion system target) [Marinoscillum furvescens DSM 4134]
MMKKLVLLLLAFVCAAYLHAQVTYDFTSELTERANTGENLVWHYISEDEGHLVNGELSPQFAALIEQAGFENIRFPGGTVSDLFDWKKTIAPVDERPQQLVLMWRNYPSTPTGEPDNPSVQFGVNEAIKMAHLAGATIVPVFSPNYNTQHHLDLYEYLTAGPSQDLDGNGVYWGAVRDSLGLAPVEVPVVEIGNELGGDEHLIWYQFTSDGFNLDDNVNRKDKGLNGGNVVFTNQKAHKGRGWVNKSQQNAPGTFKSDGVRHEVFYALFPPIHTVGNAKVGTDYSNSANYEVYEPVFIADTTDPADPAIWSAFGPNDKKFVFRKSDGLIMFGDGVNGKKIPANVNVFMDYTSGPHDGYLHLHNALKNIDPNIVISDGGELNTTQKDAEQIHGGFSLQNATNGLADGDIITEFMGKAYFSYAEYLKERVTHIPNGTEIIVGEHATLDFGPGANISVTDAQGVTQHQREYTILGALQQVIESERMTIRFGRHTNHPVTVFNKTSMTNQAHSIKSHSYSGAAQPDSVFTTSMGVAQEFFIRHTGKIALQSTANSIPTVSMKHRNLTSVNTFVSKPMPKYIAYASRDEGGEYVFLTAINPSGTTVYTPEFTVNNLPTVAFDTASALVTVLRSDSIYAVNSPTNRNAIRIDTLLSNPDLTLDSANLKVSFSLEPLTAKTVKLYAGGLPVGQACDTPPSGFVTIKNESLGGYLEWTTLPDPTDAAKDEVRLIDEAVGSAYTKWEFVPSTVSGWYNLQSENGNLLQLTDITDQIGNTTGLALRTVSSTTDGSWKRWRLKEAGNDECYIENHEFGNYVRATDQVQNSSLPAYYVHGGPTSSNGPWAKWKIDTLGAVPISWTYIDNTSAIGSPRLQQASTTDPSPGAAAASATDLHVGLDQWTGDWVQWKMVPVSGANFYFIEGKGSPKRLQSVSEVETKEGVAGYATRLVPTTNVDDFVQWEVVMVAGDTFRLKNKGTGYYLRATDITWNGDSDKLEVFSVPETSLDSKTSWKFNEVSAGARLAGNEGSPNLLSFYPNPVKQGDKIMLTLGNGVDPYEIAVLDLNGRIMDCRMQEKPEQGLIYLETENLGKGVYMLTFKQGGSAHNFKFIIE